jgi:RNA polymerase primary sigma factor
MDKELGRRPTNEEIGRRMDVPVEKVQKLKTISRDPVSLETPVGRDGESALGDLIEDRWVGSPVDAVIEGNVRDETAGILPCGERAQYVGWPDGAHCTRS